MKELRIGTRLALVFLFCIILSTIIGVVAIVNIAKIRGDITEIKLCKDIEIENLECRRQEKFILLLGPYEKATLEGKEEKTYLEKINDNLSALKGLVGEAKKE
jgi:phosphoglycerate-specific signal transduction histidine kinase